MWASALDRGKSGPITQFKRASRLLEIRISKLVQLQTVTCSENQLVKGAKFVKKPCTLRSTFIYCSGCYGHKDLGDKNHVFYH
jgi:hypothetical protein